MKVSERVELYYLQRYDREKHKIKPVTEIAEICTKCPGRCKAQAGLKACGKQTRERMKGNG